jgi:hypothetical protein
VTRHVPRTAARVVVANLATISDPTRNVDCSLSDFCALRETLDNIATTSCGAHVNITKSLDGARDVRRDAAKGHVVRLRDARQPGGGCRLHARKPRERVTSSFTVRADIDPSATVTW